MWGNKLRIFLIIAILTLVCTNVSVSAREITVDKNVSGADFKSIQEAVNNSSAGDTIIVMPGTYNENVNVSVENISVITSSDKPENTIVRAFNLSKNKITLKGFTIQETLNLQKDNFYEPDASDLEYCTVKNNVLKGGINAKDCYNSSIDKNTILNRGISVSGPDHSTFTISNNLIVNGRINVYKGPYHCILVNNTLLNESIMLTECGYNKIIDNHISNSPYSGISLWESYVNEIKNNTVINCSNGISMSFHSSENIIDNNTLIRNNKGILIEGDGGGGQLLLNNTILKNNIGISVGGDSSSNLVANNRVELNKEYGIHLNGIVYTRPFNRTNQFYNNIFNNKINLFNDTVSYYTIEAIENGARIFPVAWNTTKTAGTNVVGGSYLGGNYWAKPDGTGFSQICADTNEDGIGDLPYNINENDTDFLPLVSPSRWNQSVIPVANFSTNITQNLAPLHVQFTDLSQNAVKWSWDFENDGIPDSKDRNPAYLYVNPGTYIVNLTASTGKETSSKTQKIEVQEAEVPPIADFSTNVTDGQVPLSVQFIDLSKNTTERIWDFNNDRIPDSTERNPIHTYILPGNYTVNLTANNTKGTVSKSTTIAAFPAQSLEDKLLLTEFQITTNESMQEKPVIYGDRILWQDNFDGNPRVYLYNISTSSETPTTVQYYFQLDRAVYGDRVVQDSWRDHNLDIYMYNLSTQKETQITVDKSDQSRPDIYGDRIVWQDSRSGLSDIYMYNLSTNQELQITCDKATQLWPAIYKDKIVWEDTRNNTGSNIYMYDLSTSKETQITTSGSAWSPDIYENTIVWQDNRNGNSDIYMCIISESEKKGSAMDFLPPNS